MANKKSVTTKKPRKTVEPKTPAKLDSSWQLTKSSAELIWKNRLVFFFILLIYAVAYVILVQGLTSPANIGNVNDQFRSVLHGHLSGLISGLSVFVAAAGTTSTSSSPGAGTYQTLLILIVSLAVIWSLRQIYSNVKFRARDAYYKGMYPMIPFLLVTLLIAIELVPLLLATILYNFAITYGTAVYFFEKFIWIILLFGLGALSLYFVSSSIFALYIVALPDMTPIKAIKSANKLVKKRRLLVMRKVLFLPVVVLVVASLILLPFILILPVLAEVVFVLLTLFIIVVAHTYLYNLYRELIK